MFAQALESIFGGFRERAERTYALLQQPGTRFLVVAAPERDAEARTDRRAANLPPFGQLALLRAEAKDKEALDRFLASATAAANADDAAVVAHGPLTAPMTGRGAWSMARFSALALSGSSSATPWPPDRSAPELKT